MKRTCLFLLLFVYAFSAQSQYTISGKVINADTKEPVPLAAVFLSHTSFGVTTDADGRFRLKRIPQGRFELIVSLVGFGTYTQLMRSDKISGDMTILLKPQTAGLPDLVLDPIEKGGWEKYGQFFLDNFIGTSFYSTGCTLTNPEVIRFRKSSHSNTLNAFANSLLVIVNESLGYTIQYQMEEFEYDYNTHILVLNGYPLFKDMSQGKSGAKIRKWQERRKDVYEGSLMHFMRAFFTNQLEKQGFEMRSLTKVQNSLKEKARQIFKANPDTIVHTVIKWQVSKGQQVIDSTKLIDSTSVYKRALLQPDSIISFDIVPADSIGFAIDSSTAGMYFKDSLQVTYLLKKAPLEYKRISREHRFDEHPVSEISLLNQHAISVLYNGFYFGAHDLKTRKFWAWWETMATLLPYDYWPPKKFEKFTQLSF